MKKLRMYSWRAAALLMGLALALPSAARADITGTIKFEGEKPKRKKINMKADPKCLAAREGKAAGTENIIINKNMTVRDSFVYLEKVDGKFSAPADSVTINQQGCVYKPHILGIMVGQKLAIKNSDSFMHNIHGLPKVNPEFNFGQPTPSTRERVFRKAEYGFKIKCDVHPWMSSWAFVMPHPFYAITDNEGNFTIETEGLPDGEYALVGWQEMMGSLKTTVQVSGGSATAELTFKDSMLKR